MVDMLPFYDHSDPSERFVSSDRQSIQLSESCDVIVTASSPFPRVHLELLAIHDVPYDVTTDTEPRTVSAPSVAPTTSATPDLVMSLLPISYTSVTIANNDFSVCGILFLAYSRYRFRAGRRWLVPRRYRRSPNDTLGLRGRFFFIQTGTQ